jgi:hypothetical protein
VRQIRGLAVTALRVSAYLAISALYVAAFIAGFELLHIEGSPATLAYCLGGEVGALVLALLMCWKVLG